MTPSEVVSTSSIVKMLRDDTSVTVLKTATRIVEKRIVSECDVETFVKFGCGLVEVDCGCEGEVSRGGVPYCGFIVETKLHFDQSRGAHLLPTYKQRPCSVPFG